MSYIPRKDDIISVGPGKRLEYFVVEGIQFRISKRLNDLKEKGPPVIFVKKIENILELD